MPIPVPCGFAEHLFCVNRDYILSVHDLFEFSESLTDNEIADYFEINWNCSMIDSDLYNYGIANSISKQKLPYKCDFNGLLSFETVVSVYGFSSQIGITLPQGLLKDKMAYMFTAIIQRKNTRENQILTEQSVVLFSNELCNNAYLPQVFFLFFILFSDLYEIFSLSFWERNTMKHIFLKRVRAEMDISVSALRILRQKYDFHFAHVFEFSVLYSFLFFLSWIGVSSKDAVWCHTSIFETFYFGFFG